jgi:PhnB protein
MSVSPIPAGYSTLTPYVIVKKAAEAIEFYKKAFGATEVMRFAGPDGSVAHAEIRIGTSMLMLGEECPQWGALAPQTPGSSPVGLCVYVDNVDAVFQQALDCGATVKQPVRDQFYGDRSGQLIDPFGHSWSVATHIEDVSAEEMQRRGDEFMKQQQPSQAA